MLKEYVKEKNKVRGDWRTHPPHRKSEHEQGIRLTQLAYGLACLLTHMDEKEKELHDLLHRMRNTADECSERGYWEVENVVSEFADDLEGVIENHD